MHTHAYTGYSGTYMTPILCTTRSKCVGTFSKRKRILSLW